MYIDINDVTYTVTQDSIAGLFTDSWPGELMRGPLVWFNSVSGPRGPDMVQVRLEFLLAASGTELDLYAAVQNLYETLRLSLGNITVHYNDGTAIISRPILAVPSVEYGTLSSDRLQALIIVTLLVGNITVL